MRIFIGGIMQGSYQANVMSDQGYREEITEALVERWPELEVWDPRRLHPNSAGYDDTAARDTLLAMLELAQQSDLVIVYLPTASMGTALEMYVAHQAGVPVIAVSPMVHNWVLRAFAAQIYPDLGSLFQRIREASHPLALTEMSPAASDD